MSVAILPDETLRMAAVRRYDVLDTPPDNAFDRIAAIAARRFGVPIAIISIVDEDRIWFKSHHGLDVEQIGREPGLCASAILGDTPYLLNDATADPRSLANPLVAGEFGLRFYAAAPLRTHDGHNLGTLCVIDREPRQVTDDQMEELADLATIVMDQLELQLSARRAVSSVELMSREIDHRVMNSLQFVSALLSLQGRTAASAEGAEHLQAAARRVSSIANVHRRSYLDGANDVACVPFLEEFCADLGSILDRPVAVSGTEGTLPADAVQSIALIVNELVTNAVKHGADRVWVNYRVEGDACELTIADDGPGLPADFAPSGTSHTLGIRVVNSLVARLNGTLSTGRGPDDNGALFTVRFKRG